ncbi:proline-rich protein 2-like [Microtus oregoni]|uniref:proline-rich protein 2-like n=1 Tax=Microtus oregoni TaxID=111838 RepID=UPI001BB1B76F|nr:proline-rich protein 2-like [Microtus oregoni]XP_041508054.1 proline-rich protein 2-like [Microtus oregoni]
MCSSSSSSRRRRRRLGAGLGGSPMPSRPRRPPPPAGLPPPPLPLAPTQWLQLRAPRLKNKQPRRRQLRALPPPGTPSGAGPVGPRSGAAAEGNAPRVGGAAVPKPGVLSLASRGVPHLCASGVGPCAALWSPRPVGLLPRPPDFRLGVQAGEGPGRARAGWPQLRGLMG